MLFSTTDLANDLVEKPGGRKLALSHAFPERVER
jgi:hypothetical protein